MFGHRPRSQLVLANNARDPRDRQARQAAAALAAPLRKEDPSVRHTQKRETEGDRGVTVDDPA